MVVEETSKKKTEKWPLVLHVDTSIFALFLIVLMGAFYVVTILSSIKVVFFNQVKKKHPCIAYQIRVCFFLFH